eukprot:CAMPEP_0173198016 /NCGR_PEP_ID=MMETSP1141-20130122/16467_1 /TAXON_ID=483371 /ORGANISM="non described non described, Strain CCMP2298" /LENGTH=149 /DNA_ID=CAMNT_0014122791 /DNA_START=113 /DNA_END=561 /DNA_ORIENTATION=-
MPSPGRVLTLSGVTLRAVIFSTRPSRLVTVLLTPDNASESVTRQTWLRLSPSLEKSGVRLGLKGENHIPGSDSGSLVPLPLERNLGAVLPAGLDHYLFVGGNGGGGGVGVVGVDLLGGDAHSLGGAFVQVLQSNVQVVRYGSGLGGTET